MANELGEFYTSNFYAWKFCAMRALSASASSRPASSAGLRSSVVSYVRSSSKDVDEAPMDDNVAGKEVVVRALDPQTLLFCHSVNKFCFTKPRSRTHLSLLSFKSEKWSEGHGARESGALKWVSLLAGLF